MNELAKIVSSGDSIAITSHVNPDGDSIGSILALGLALNQRHKNVEIFIDEALPNKYSFLPQSKHIKKKYEDVKGKNLIYFCVGCGNKKG